MHLDESLLLSLKEKEQPILHFYDWENRSITYGVFTNPADFLDLKECDALKIDLAKRVTGGGITLHLWDFAFTFLMPANHPKFSTTPLDNYAFVNGVVRGAVSRFRKGETELKILQKEVEKREKIHSKFCMAGATIYDVICDGKKVAGSAQRLKKHGYLHHGTISLLPPEEKVLEAILLKKGAIKKAILEHSHPLIADRLQLEDSRNKIKRHLIYAFKEALSHG